MPCDGCSLARRGAVLARFSRVVQRATWVIHLSQAPTLFVGQDGCEVAATARVRGQPGPSLGGRPPPGELQDSPCEGRAIHSAHARMMLDLIEMDNPSGYLQRFARLDPANARLLVWNDLSRLPRCQPHFPFVARAAAMARLPLRKLGGLKQNCSTGRWQPAARLGLRGWGSVRSLSQTAIARPALAVEQGSPGSRQETGHAPGRSC